MLMSGQSPAGKSIGAAEQRRAQEAVFVARWPEQTRAVRPFSRRPPHLTRPSLMKTSGPRFGPTVGLLLVSRGGPWQ